MPVDIGAAAVGAVLCGRAAARTATWAMLVANGTGEETGRAAVEATGAGTGSGATGGGCETGVLSAGSGAVVGAEAAGVEAVEGGNEAATAGVAGVGFITEATMAALVKSGALSPTLMAEVALIVGATGEEGREAG